MRRVPGTRRTGCLLASSCWRAARSLGLRLAIGSRRHDSPDTEERLGARRDAGPGLQGPLGSRVAEGSIGRVPPVAHALALPAGALVCLPRRVGDGLGGGGDPSPAVSGNRGVVSIPRRPAAAQSKRVSQDSHPLPWSLISFYAASAGPVRVRSAPPRFPAAADRTSLR